MTKQYPKGKPFPRKTSYLNGKIKAITTEANRASNSRKLMKARVTALTAKVSLLESEVKSIFEVLGLSDINSVMRAKVDEKLLTKATRLGKEEE